MTLRLTESELAEIQNRRAAWAKPTPVQKANLTPGNPAEKRGLNKWELHFADQLEYRRMQGEIVWWAFEPFRIRLADDTFYKPDFVTVDKDGRTEIYEVKGFMREAARVRLKVAVERLPYQFYIVRRHKGRLRVTKL
jgi:hypothetical protein